MKPLGCVKRIMRLKKEVRLCGEGVLSMVTSLLSDLLKRIAFGDVS